MSDVGSSLLLTGTLLGFGAAFVWGASNVLVALVGRRIGSLPTLAGWQMASLVLSVGLVAAGQAHLPPDPLRITLGIAAGAIGFFAYLTLFAALGIGPIAVVSPVIAANGGVTVLLAVALLSESVRPIQAAGIVVATLGVVLCGVKFQREWRHTRLVGPGVAIAIVAVFLFAAFNVASSIASRDLGWQTALVGSRVTMTVLALIALLLPRLRLLGPSEAAGSSRGILWRVALGSTFNAIGVVAFMIGMAIAPAWLIGLTTSFSPMVAVIFGVIFLRERPSRVQWLGAALVLVSLPLIAI
jgi:drug/metabolite transporter (DMT)-like permease